MIVSELIKILQEKDQNQKVLIQGYEGGFDHFTIGEENVRMAQEEGKEKERDYYGRFDDCKSGEKAVIFWRKD